MKKPEVQNKIKLLRYQITEVDFRFDNSIPTEELTKDLGIKLGYTPCFDDENTREFFIEFVINVTNKDEKFVCKMKAVSIFETSMEIDKDFLSTTFCNVSAPAIVFPYLRAFITNLTVNAGLNPVILPAFNFQKAVEVLKEKENESEEVNE